VIRRKSMNLTESWCERIGTKSQNLLGAVELLSKEGFAITKAEALTTGEIIIQCAYLGNSESPKSDPVTK
jgi:hypothetical protein